MARIRTTKPEFWTSEQIMSLSLPARLAFIGLWNFCDDSGIHPASPKTVKAEIFPSDNVEVEPLVGEWIAQGLVTEYEVDGKAYWIVTGWHHQRIDQPTYKYPLPDGTYPKGAPRRRSQAEAPPRSNVFAECSPNTPRTFDKCSPPEGKGREGKVKKPSSPEALRLSGLLADLILQNNPGNTKLSNGKRETTVTRWAVDIDKLIRIDGRTPEEIERVIRWCQSHPFWRANILSGSKLREQFDQLVVRMQGDGKAINGKPDEDRYGMFAGVS